MSTNQVALRPAPTPPHGIDQVIAKFGDIFAYLRTNHSLDPRWERDVLAECALPFPIPLSWDRSRQVTHIRCHKLLQSVFGYVFDAIQNAGLQQAITTFGGCYSFRPQRTGTRLSAHSWGIAIDLNPESNAQGTAGDMDPALIAIFQQAGFTWGGDWRGSARDPMHFQFCTGYSSGGKPVQILLNPHMRAPDSSDLQDIHATHSVSVFHAGYDVH